MKFKSTINKFLSAILLLGCMQAAAQTYNDGAMQIQMSVGYSYVESVDDPLTGELNANEFRWRWWGADNADLDGQGFAGGTIVGVNSSNSGWVLSQDIALLNYTYGTPGSTPQQVPQYVSLQGEGWEDDCFDCYRSTGTFTWACDQCSSFSYDGGCTCSTNILCGCSAEDQHCGPYTINNTINYRAIAPCLGLFSPNAGNTNGSAWVGDFIGTTCGNDDIGAEILVYWTPPIPDAVVGTASILCQPGLVTLQTGGAVFGGEYHWYDNGTNLLVGTGSQITPFVGSTTTFRVHTYNGTCESLSYRLYTVTVGSPTIASVTSTNPLCNGSSDGSITVNASGGNGALQYSRDGGANFQSSNVFTNLPAGFYNIVVKDGSGCTVIYQGNSVILNQPTAVSIFVNKVDALCNGGSTGRIDIFAGGGSGNLSYSVDNGTTFQPSSIFANLPAGPYNIVVQDASGCSYPFLGNPVVVSEPSVVTASTTVTDASCGTSNNGSVQVTAAGGTSPYNYSLNNGPYFPNPIFTGLASGNYTFLVADVNGCTASTSATVGSIYTLTASVLSQTDVSCDGGADGTVTVTSAGGVAPFQFSIDGGLTWQPDSLFTGLAGGTYNVVVKDANGCTDNVSATVIQKPLLTLVADSIIPSNCFTSTDGAVYIHAEGGTPAYTYAWSNSTTNQNLTGVGNGSYTVVVTDTRTCTAQATYQVSSPSKLISAIAGNNPDCHDKATGFAVVTAGGGTMPYHYVWSTVPAQSGIMAVNLKGDITYSVTTTDANGCTITDSVALTNPTPVVVTTAPGNVTCYNGNNGTVTIGASGGTGPYQYSLNNVYQQDSVLTGLTAGEYTAIAQDNNGCFGATNFTIGEPSSIAVDAGPDQVSVRGQTVTLNGTASSANGIIAYIWSPDDHLSCTACQSTNANPDTTTTYYLTAIDGDTCSAYDSVTVIVLNKVQYFIPTAFTPNNDGLNDYFEVNILGASAIEVSVFNRWGERIYFNAAQHNGLLNNGDAWDGKRSGKMLPYDTYVYQLKVSYANPDAFPDEVLKGTVTLMR